MNSRQSVETYEFEILKTLNLKFLILEKCSKNLPKTGKIAEVYFLRIRFHLMRQSELKLIANEQFYLVDYDAKRIEGRKNCLRKILSNSFGFL